MIKRFNRYEIKYVIPVSVLPAMIADLRKFMSEDSYSSAGQGYRISSLYYDSFDYDFYRNKVDGIKFRRKLRIRRYEGDSGDCGWVEIKQRYNRVVQKRRLRASLDDCYALCDGVGIEFSSPDDRKLAAEVRYINGCMRLRRSCIIRYTRRAFQGGLYEPGLRVTFDTHLKYRINALELAVDAPMRFFLPPQVCVMEVKANERIPLWLTSFLARYNCDLTRVSKYCLGLRLGLQALERKRTLLAGGPPQSAGEA